MNMPTKIDISKEKEIISIYLSGKTTHETAKIVGCSQTCVMKVLKRNKIDRRSIYSYTRKYLINENFFKKINNEEKAYFLGLIFADGNNYRSELTTEDRKDYQISISLQEEDKYIIEKLRDMLAPTKELDFVPKAKENHKNQYRLRIDSKTVSNQLTKLGCVPAKSLILKYPDILPEFHHHFLRGYFDGDGSINFWIKKSKINKNYNLSIISTKYFIEETINIIKLYTNLNLHSRLSCKSSNNITTTASIGGNHQILKLMTWLYKDATIFIIRKYNKYIELKNLIND